MLEDNASSNFLGVWELISPYRDALVRLWRVASRKGILYRVLTWMERRYVEALMLAKWDRILSPLVLKILAPIVRKMLRALGSTYRQFQLQCEGDVDKDEIKGLLSTMCPSTYRIMKNVAEEISQLAQRWGNKLSLSWPKDSGFIKYLIMMNLPQNNNPHSIFTIKF
jgi:hypothetical protein